MTRSLHASARWLAVGFGAAVAIYGAYVGLTWYRYGDVTVPNDDEKDPLLDRFMPTYEVVERHHIRVAAPAAVTFAVARDVELLASPVVRAIVRAREILLGAAPDERRHPRGLVSEMESLGWGVLAEDPGREFVVGAATKPWEANVTFRALAPDRFASFEEPGYVKIAWTIRADPVDESESVFGPKRERSRRTRTQRPGSGGTGPFSRLASLPSAGRCSDP